MQLDTNKFLAALLILAVETLRKLVRIPPDEPASKKGRYAMLKRLMCSLVMSFVLILPASGVWAESMPEGVTMVVLKESAVTHLPGVAKTKYVELRIAPGASWMNHTITDSGFCTGIQGAVTIEVGGKTVSKFAGDSWVMKKGPTVNMYNRGTVEHVQRMWILIEG